MATTSRHTTQFLAAPVVSTDTPPKPTVLDLADQTLRRLALRPEQPITAHGFVDSGVGVPGTTPPAPTVVDRADQRVRFRPLDATVIRGVFVPVAAAVLPPLATVIDRADQRIRFRPQDATVIRGVFVPAAPAGDTNQFLMLMGAGI